MKLMEYLEYSTSSLYTDQGADGTQTNEMGVYLDLGMGLASTLLPSQNTVTAPKAGEIVNEDGTTTTLDGTYTAVNDIAWTVELSDRTDIFVGRDSVADSASATGYLPGVETIIATGGDDEIDGGGGYNVADFSNQSTGVQFNMTMGHATFESNNQQWFGFQSVMGTTSA